MTIEHDHDTARSSLPGSSFTSPKRPKLKHDAEANQFQTPTKSKTADFTLNNGADQSAIRKSKRLLLKRKIQSDVESEDNDDLGNEALAEQIIGEDDDSDAEDRSIESELDAFGLPEAAEDQEATPSKPKRRGRPPGKLRVPEVPLDVSAAERYFSQNRPGAIAVAFTVLDSQALLDHEDCFEELSDWTDPHQHEVDFLHGLHRQSFHQWLFELEQKFSICLFGYGSKRETLIGFAETRISAAPDLSIVVINGYDSTLSIRDVMICIASCIPSLRNQKLGAQPSDALTIILDALAQDPPSLPITLIVNSIDGIALRRGLAQRLLAGLAQSTSIHFVASADTLNFPLFWDTSLRAAFSWVFHDNTTFCPYGTELACTASGGIADIINQLLGRSSRKITGKEGVMYVLKSLTHNARKLYTLLVAEVVSADNGAPGATTREDQDMGLIRYNQVNDVRGVEYRTLYNQAVSQFIATNEMSFRGLLKEFVDHEMIVSKRDNNGSEILSVPLATQDMMLLLEELTVDS